MNKYQYALHNLNSFYLSDFVNQKEALIANENYKKQLDTLNELVDRFTEEEKLEEIKAPSIRFVPLKKGMTEDDVNEYMIGNESNFLIYLRCKYKSQHEWEYLTEAASPGFDDGICWLNDWWEGQQDVEYLAISKLGE